MGRFGLWPLVPIFSVLCCQASAGIMGEDTRQQCRDDCVYTMGRSFDVEDARCHEGALVHDVYTIRLEPNSGFLDARIQAYDSLQYNFTETQTDATYVAYNFTNFLASTTVSVIRDNVKVQSIQSTPQGQIHWVNPAQTFSATTNWSFIKEERVTNLFATAYIDGGNIGTRSGLAPNPYVWNRTSVGRLGDSTPSNYFSGCLDEARVSSVARSGDWITTEHNNQASQDTFLQVSAEVTYRV
jgi:hypothetical protein